MAPRIGIEPSLRCAIPSSEPPGYLRVSPVDAIGGSTNGSTMANRRVPYLYTKRGVFYLQKRVPADLQHRYGRPFIRKSLRTKDPKQANRLASSLVDGLEREWLDLRFGISEETPASDLLLLQREQEILLSDACADYCRMKGRTDDKKFRQLAERVTDQDPCWSIQKLRGIFYMGFCVLEVGLL